MSVPGGPTDSRQKFGGREINLHAMLAIGGLTVLWPSGFSGTVFICIERWTWGPSTRTHSNKQYCIDLLPSFAGSRSSRSSSEHEGWPPQKYDLCLRCPSFEVLTGSYPKSRDFEMPGVNGGGRRCIRSLPSMPAMVANTAGSGRDQ